MDCRSLLSKQKLEKQSILKEAGSGEVGRVADIITYVPLVLSVSLKPQKKAHSNVQLSANIREGGCPARRGDLKESAYPDWVRKIVMRWTTGQEKSQENKVKSQLTQSLRQQGGGSGGR